MTFSIIFNHLLEQHEGKKYEDVDSLHDNLLTSISSDVFQDYHPSLTKTSNSVFLNMQDNGQNLMVEFHPHNFDHV